VVVIRVGTPVERAFAGFAHHVWRCQACTGGLCLLALGQSPPQLCREGRWRLVNVRRLWNPGVPITIRRRGRTRLFGAWDREENGQTATIGASTAARKPGGR